MVNPDDRLHRLEAVHLRGFDGRGTKSEDIYEYFKASKYIHFCVVLNKDCQHKCMEHILRELPVVKH